MSEIKKITKASSLRVVIDTINSLIGEISVSQDVVDSLSRHPQNAIDSFKCTSGNITNKYPITKSGRYYVVVDGQGKTQVTITDGSSNDISYSEEITNSGKSKSYVLVAGDTLTVSISTLDTNGSTVDVYYEKSALELFLDSDTDTLDTRLEVIEKSYDECLKFVNTAGDSSSYVSLASRLDDTSNRVESLETKVKTSQQQMDNYNSTLNDLNTKYTTLSDTVASMSTGDGSSSTSKLLGVQNHFSIYTTTVEPLNTDEITSITVGDTDVCSRGIKLIAVSALSTVRIKNVFDTIGSWSLSFKIKSEKSQTVQIKCYGIDTNFEESISATSSFSSHQYNFTLDSIKDNYIEIISGDSGAIVIDDIYLVNNTENALQFLYAPEDFEAFINSTNNNFAVTLSDIKSNSTRLDSMEKSLIDTNENIDSLDSGANNLVLNGNFYDGFPNSNKTTYGSGTSVAINSNLFAEIKDDGTYPNQNFGKALVLSGQLLTATDKSTTHQFWDGNYITIKPNTNYILQFDYKIIKGTFVGENSSSAFNIKLYSDDIKHTTIVRTLTVPYSVKDDNETIFHCTYKFTTGATEKSLSLLYGFKSDPTVLSSIAYTNVTLKEGTIASGGFSYGTGDLAPFLSLVQSFTPISSNETEFNYIKFDNGLQVGYGRLLFKDSELTKETTSGKYTATKALDFSCTFKNADYVILNSVSVNNGASPWMYMVNSLYPKVNGISFKLVDTMRTTNEINDDCIYVNYLIIGNWN